MSLDEGSRGYVAGVVDCDGSICIIRDKNGYLRLKLGVYNSCKGMTDWFSAKLGGKSTSSRPRNSRCSTEYSWSVYNQKAADVIGLILPYMVVKRRQALLAIEFASTLGRSDARLPNVFKEIRQRVYEEMKELNMRGMR